MIRKPVFPPRPPCNAPSSFVDDSGQVWLSPSPALPLSATLADRIADWRAAPVANQSVWEEFNAQTCTISPSDHRIREREVSGPARDLARGCAGAGGSQLSGGPFRGARAAEARAHKLRRPRRRGLCQVGDWY